MLKIDDKVVVSNDEDGVMFATVIDIVRNGAVAVLMPDEPALKAWFPRGYELGSAHWHSKIRVRT